jgi:uncharacterized surface anchored protein
MRRKIITLCLACLLILGCLPTVLAQEFDPQKTGSISVTLTEQYRKDPIVGARLNVYYVAKVRMNADGSLIYIPTDAFANAELALEDPALADKLEAYVSQHHVDSLQVTTDENGTAVCRELAPGLYFVRQTGAVDGFAPCAPFVVTLPFQNDREFVYDVNASPKTQVAKLTTITIKKVWNTDASTQAAESVTVQLLRKGNVVQTATLNAQNNWQVTYANMPESDAYSIKEVNVPKGFIATYSQTGYVFTVTNTASLIQTGQLVWPIPVLAMGGMLFLAVGIVLLRKKREPNA